MKHLTTEDTTMAISKILKEVGVPISLLGYEYVKFGIALTVEDSTIIRRATTDLYPAIAERYSTTASRAERVIRNAVETACDRGGPDVLEKYFGNSVNPHTGKPTNRQFIATLAEYIREGA